jgi:hypothetical protein
MARLTKADAARQMGISRTTLYKFIHEGTVSVHPDGTIDTAELVRAVSTLAGSRHHRGRASSVQPVLVDEPAVDVGRQRDEHYGVSNGQVDERSQWTSSERQLTSSYREMVDMLRAQLAVADAREAASREHIARLTAMLHESQQQQTRLLEAPRPVTIPQAVPRVRQPAALWPGTWQQIHAYLVAQAGPARPRDVGRGLGLRTAAYIMRRMCDAGILARLGPGVYQLADPQ